MVVQKKLRMARDQDSQWATDNRLTDSMDRLVDRFEHFVNSWSMIFMDRSINSAPVQI